ncbi:MAG: hypothetical protein LUG44_02380, partial [Clostridiales bacterium]|nr:hypothetical protein [Clostridiales bacterium]
LFSISLPGASGNNKILVSQSRKTLKFQRFSGFVFFAGYLHLLVGVQVAVGVHGGLHLSAISSGERPISIEWVRQRNVYPGGK